MRTRTNQPVLSVGLICTGRIVGIVRKDYLTMTAERIHVVV